MKTPLSDRISAILKDSYTYQEESPSNTLSHMPYYEYDMYYHQYLMPKALKLYEGNYRKARKWAGEHVLLDIVEYDRWWKTEHKYKQD